MNIGRTIVMAGLAAAALTFGLAHAQAGECAGACYEKVSGPPVYRTIVEPVMVAPPLTRTRVTPAQFVTVPQVRTIAPEHIVARQIPAEYATVNEKIMVSPGGKRWVVRRDYHGREIGCWEETPPRFVVRQRTVLVRPASTFYERVPAVRAARPQHIMVAPPSVTRETIPAVYAMRRVVTVSPGPVEWKPLERRY
ncbi:MAG: hypothetical protein BGP06_01835 [Rhizobiales bacterium 65-9]|nr:hypothetical protein [Hyphomicrobiales bacterium]OJY38766.1 MAG: hypothetical protein BGP06_01835 [Rhizobiales bacterium 65-9]